MKCLPIEDLADEILLRIFEYVIGSPMHDPHAYFYTFFEISDNISATVVANFIMATVLPCVCRRWNRIVSTSPKLWRNVYIGPFPTSKIESHSLHMPPMAWWANKARDIERLHLNTYKTVRDGQLDAFNIGILSLTSPKKLRTLVLDKCFQDGASETVIKSISYITSLVQLSITQAREELVSSICCLTVLKNLKSLELDCMDGCEISLYDNYFPISLEYLGLGNLQLHTEFTEDSGGFLTNLRKLSLISVNVFGEFCLHIGQLNSLIQLVLNDVAHEDLDNLADFSIPEDLKRLSLLKNIRHLEIQDVEVSQRGFFEWLGEEAMNRAPFDSLESLCLMYPGIGVMSPGFSKYTEMKYLHIEEVTFDTIPLPVMELPKLVYLAFVGCALTDFPDTKPKCRFAIRELILSRNRLSTIPKSISYWYNLEKLDLVHNPITSFEYAEHLLQLLVLKELWMFTDAAPVTKFSLVCIPEKIKDPVSAFKLGFVCGKLVGRNPPCAVFI